MVVRHSEAASGPGERSAADVRDLFAERNGRQAAAALERERADRGHAVRDVDLAQGGTILKCRFPDRQDALRERDFLQGGASPEHLIQARFLSGYPGGEPYSLQGGAVSERFVSDLFHLVGNVHLTQGGAILECPMSDFPYAVRDADGGQMPVVQECAVVDRFHAVRDDIMPIKKIWPDLGAIPFFDQARTVNEFPQRRARTDHGHVNDLGPRRDPADVHVVHERLKQRNGQEHQQEDQHERPDPFDERHARRVVLRRRFYLIVRFVFHDREAFPISGFCL